MASSRGHDMFELVPLIKNIDIKLSAGCESGVKQILGLVTRDNDVVLYYTFGELPPVLKQIPWFSDSYKTIQALCFDPTATWLLVVCSDCSLYIIPALSLVDKKLRIDCKWSLNDVTHFPRHSQIPQAIPTSVIWWQTLDSNQNALVGFDNGSIVLISLTDGRCIGSCRITEAVRGFCLCHDIKSDVVSLLINGMGGQQWKLVLEHRSNGYYWPPELANQGDDSTRSRLHNLKQMGVDKFFSFKQRLSEAGRSRRDSQTSDSASESSSHSESVHSGPEMLPHLCDMVFSHQFARDRHFISAFYKPTDLLTVHSADTESAPIFVYKLIPKTDLVLLCDKVIYAVHEERNTISILSTVFTECPLEGDSEFNSEALLKKFQFDDCSIQQIYKITDTIPGNTNRTSKKAADLTFPKSIEECSLNKLAVDTCFIVTTNSVYRINVSQSPILKFMRCVLDESDLETAEKLAKMFEFKMSPLLEQCGDILLANGSFHSGIIRYNQAKVHLLKRVLKVAVTADCKTLLKFIQLCLSASKVDMSIATKIHIGNLAIMAYTEMLLRFSGQQRVANTKDFMNFLCSEEYYDEILAVNISCQAGHWNIITLLAKCRGLQLEVVSALGQILQTSRAPKSSDIQFLYALSEPSLTQSLLVSGQTSQTIFHYVRTNVDSFPVAILKRLVVQYDPSQPSALPLVAGLFRTMKYNASSLDTTNESADMDNPDKSMVVVGEFIDTFLCVLICLTSKTERNRFNLELLHNIDPPEQPVEEQTLKRFPESKQLSCGYEHTAIIRNSNLYTMGASTAGCLGLGPLLTTSSPPKLVRVLNDLKIKAISVSCGRKHTLLLTDCGVYSWGSNTFGQLGLGPHIVDSPHPQMLTCLSSTRMVDVAAGQYHSLALTSSGKVYTWGWGIHGQLGHGNCNNEFRPRALEFSKPARQIAAGHAHSLILTEEGKVYGFGSNVFGQLEGCQMEVNKSTGPVWIVVRPDLFVPVEKIATAYFHNIAINANQEVYTWGASPQELRIFQSKNNQKHNGISHHMDSWKATINIYTATDNKPIEQVAVGYRHSVVLHNGNIFWGKSKDEELCSPKQRQQDILMTQKFLHISCGLDYTMAIDHCGKLMAWGSASMAQTLLGKPMSEENRRLENKIIIFKNTRRLVKFPNSAQGTTENTPIEVPGLPTMAITFNPSDHISYLSKIRQSYSVLKIENENISFKMDANSFDHIYDSPKFKFGYKTLHYALETYYGFYDFETVLAKCLDAQNYQAAAKIAMLNGHYVDSLGFQLRAFKKHLEALDLPPISKETSGVEIIVRSMQDDMNEKNLIYNVQSPAHILSSSSSLDSIRQWGDEVEHQGGCESPCDMGDVRHNVTQYVQSLRIENDSNSPPISVISDIVDKKPKTPKQEPPLKDENLIEAIETASTVVEFYIKKIYMSENHILMQNVLMKCIEFWLANYLPVSILETILLKNMDKYFYPLSVLLFCKDFGDSGDTTPEKPAPGFLKEFSTKFCLQLCSMVLDNVNKS